jgi:SNF family Na+-dependent transporter
LLVLAAVTSSISMLQPAFAFLAEGLGLSRGAAMVLLATITGTGTLLVIWFTQDTVALDVIDFWVGSAMLIVLALFEVVLFGWVLGAEKGIEEANRGGDIRIPKFFAFVLRWICPAYLVAILGAFAYHNLGAQIASVIERPAATITVLYLIAVLGLMVVLVQVASRRWTRERRFERTPG